jgi:hypothetical protein
MVSQVKQLPPKQLFSINETGHVIGKGPTTIYQLINRGELDAVKDGYRTFITRESIERRIASLKPITTPTMAKAAHERGDLSVQPDRLRRDADRSKVKPAKRSLKAETAP